jgi:hypothetical protein
MPAMSWLGPVHRTEARAAHVHANQQRVCETEQSRNTFVTVYKTNDSILKPEGAFLKTLKDPEFVAEAEKRA